PIASQRDPMFRTMFHAPRVRRPVGAALFVGVFLAVTAALPRAHASADDVQKCEQASGIIAIAACTRAIDSGQFQGHELAELHSNRALEYRAKGDHDNSIADYNTAIRLDPRFALAFFGRGNTWQARRDNDRAIADFSEAIRLDPNYLNAYNNRGTAWLAKE